VAEDLNNERLATLGALGRLTQQINRYNEEGIQNAQRENELNRERIRLGRELQQINDKIQKSQRQAYVDSQNDMKSMASMYDPLKKADMARIDMMLKAGNLSDLAVQRGNTLAEVNKKIAELTSDQVLERQILQDQFDSEITKFARQQNISQEIVDNLKNQNQLARDYSSMTEGQKEQLEAQLEAYNGIKKTIGGILDTASILTSGPAGLLGMSLIGAGKFLGKMGEVRGELGGIAEFGTTALAFFDDNAVANAKELASQFGGINNVSGELQASTSLISVNMGISGVEAAGLIGSFARLNGNSQETALNLTKASQEFAAQNGLIPGALMADLADNTEAFALFGKEGGKNMIQAAGAAAKMGVSLKTMTGLADNLLDFESSINNEMELGAMLGKDINLDKARALAYQGDLAGATQETLRALGGVDAFNKMDYFQKKKTAELMGTSVEELQKMVTNQEQAATMGGKINATFSLVGETINAGLNKYLGTSLEALGGMVMAGAQLGGSFSQMGFDIKGMASKIPIVGKLFGGGKSPIAAVSEKATEAGAAGDTAGAAGAKSGGGLKSLAEGLKEMGNTKVLFGALNLMPTALGLVTMLVGIPSLMAIAALGTEAGLGLEFIGVGLQAMGNTNALFGTGVLAAAGLAFGIMTVGIVGLAGIALGGEAAGAGLVGLSIGLEAIGAAAATGIPFLGVALIAAFGLALIPFAYALSLTAPLVQTIGDVIVNVVTAIAAGIQTMISSITLMMQTLLPLMNMDNAAGLLAMAGGFAALSLSLAAFAVSSLMAIPGMIAVGMFLAVGGGDLLSGGMGGGAAGGGAGMDELITEIKGLRADLASGKIGVNMDGQKVTSKITSVVDKGSTNSYAK